MSVIEMLKSTKTDANLTPVDHDSTVREALEAQTAATATYRAAEARVRELRRLTTEAGAGNRESYLEAVLALPEAEQVLARAELELIAARRRYAAVRDDAVKARVPVLEAWLRGEVRARDVVADEYAAANNGVLAVWQLAETVLGSNQKQIPNLAEGEFLAETPHQETLLAHRRRLYRQEGWL